MAVAVVGAAGVVSAEAEAAAEDGERDGVVVVVVDGGAVPGVASEATITGLESLCAFGFSLDLCRGADMK